MAAFRPFVERLQDACRLQPATLTKYEAGALAAGLRDGSGCVRFYCIEADAPIGHVGLAVLRRQFAALRAREPGTRLGDDSEELHDMRVASRRLRAALSLFAAFSRLRRRPSRRPRWVGGTLGAVRDLDVQLESSMGGSRMYPRQTAKPFSHVRSLLETKRSVPRETMLDALDSRRYELFIGRFGRAAALGSRPSLRPGLAAGPGGGARPDRGALPRPSECGRADRGRLAGGRVPSGANPGQAVPVCARVPRRSLPGRTRPLIKRVVALQDILGLHQDAEVAIERLRRLASEHGAELHPEAIFAMGEIAERYRLNATELRARFPEAYGRVTGKTWKTFAKLDRGRAPRPDSLDCGGPSSEVSNRVMVFATKRRALRSVIR